MAFSMFKLPKLNYEAFQPMFVDWLRWIRLGPECFNKERVQTRTRTITTIQHLVTFKYKYRPLGSLSVGVVYISVANLELTQMC